MQVGFGGDKCMGSNAFCFDHPEFQSLLMHGGGGGVGKGRGYKCTLSGDLNIYVPSTRVWLSESWILTKVHNLSNSCFEYSISLDFCGQE